MIMMTFVFRWKKDANDFLVQLGVMSVKMAESQILAQNSCNADTGLLEVGNSVSALNNKNEANCWQSM